DLGDQCDCLLTGGDGGDHLGQFHDRGRVEEVQPDDLVRPPSERCDLGHRQRGRVGGQNRARGADPVQITKDVLLDVHVFGNGFHDEVRIRKVLTGGREGQAGVDRRAFLLAELSPADRSGKGPVHVATWTGDRKSTRLNSSHVSISYAVFCLKKKI